MSTSAKAKIQIETGRTLTSFVAMTDSDHQIFYRGTIWSNYDGSEPVVRPDGVVSGRNLLTVSAVNDTITVAAFTAYSKGTLQEVSATTSTFTRGTGPGKAKVISVYMGSDGAVAVEPGTEGSGATFSDTRAAAGGPPLIPVGGVELGQIRTTVSTAQAVTAAEIFQVPGSHVERFNQPDWSEFPVGKGYLADTAHEKKAHIKFSSAIAADHVGPTYKHVYIQYYTPIFTELMKTMDFVPAENTHSVSSTEYYNGTIASKSSSLGQGSFTALMTDNVSDTLLGEQDELITVKFFPNRNKAPYILTQGTLGVVRTFPVDNQNQAACTISSEEGSVSFES